MVTAWLSAQLLLLRASVPGVDVLADEVIDGPEPEEVKAGWTAFAIFLLLALAVVVLGRSLVVQLRKAQRAADEGVYGEPPARPGAGETGGAAGASGRRSRSARRGPTTAPTRRGTTRRAGESKRLLRQLPLR